MNKGYQDIEQAMKGIKTPIIAIAVIGVTAQVILLASGLPRNGDVREYSSLEACYYGMKSLFNHAPKEGLFAKKVIEGAKGHKFRIEKITLVKLLDGYTCDVVAKDPKGYRSYRVALDKNSKFPYLFRIINVQGQKIVSPYQWRNP